MKYSVFIPFLSKSKTIQRCLNALHQNSVHEHEIVLTVGEKDVYYAFNEGVYKCKNDVVVLLNDDMVVSKGWDALIPQYASPDVILTTYVVEPNPGGLPIGPSCIKHDCGDENNFDYDKFERFVAEDSKDKPDLVPNAIGWFMPTIINKKTFVTFPNVIKFPICANDILWANMLHQAPECEYKFAVLNSYTYHFGHATSRA
jgi:glycosyltransferase involved in cell wall biosynthesis